MHGENVKRLSESMENLSEELEKVKKKMDEKGMSMTNTAPLVEIRVALQRLKSENKELDVQIGVLVREKIFQQWLVLSLIKVTSFILLLKSKGLRAYPNENEQFQPPRAQSTSP